MRRRAVAAVLLAIFLLSAPRVHAQAAPSRVDLLADSDSYVPPFYRGRALPSAGTDIRLQAIAYFRGADGSLIPSSDLTYTWRQDDRVIGNISGLGRSSVVLPAAILYGTTDIEVDVESSDDTLSGSASVAIASADPILMLYEDDPLLGFTFFHAVAGDASISDTEMTFAAVPYFAQVQSPNDPRLIYSWTVNGSPVSASASDPSEITLNAADSSGMASVGLTLTHTTNFFMDSAGSWDIALGGSGSSGGPESAGAKNPFTGESQ